MMHKNIFKSIYYLCYVDFVLMINRGSNTFYLLLFRQKKNGIRSACTKME